MIGLAIDLNHELLCHIGDRGVIETHVVEIVILNIDIALIEQITDHNHSSGDRPSEVCRREEVGAAKAIVIVCRVIDLSGIQSHLIHDGESMDLEGGQLETGCFGDGERGTSLHSEERVTVLIIDRNRSPTDENIKVTTWTARDNKGSTHAEAVSNAELRIACHEGEGPWGD